MPKNKYFTYIHALFNLFRNVMNYSNFWKIDWTLFDWISEYCLEGAHLHQPTHAHIYIARAVAVTDSCLAFIGAHQHGIAVGLMNEENPCLKEPLLQNSVQSTPYSASSTQHMWELLAGNRTAVLPPHTRGRRIIDWCMCAPCFKIVN